LIGASEHSSANVALVEQRDSGNKLRTSPAARRGERLYPKRSSRIYWHLTALRTELEAVVREHLQSAGDKVLADFGCGNMPYRPLFQPDVGQYLGCDLAGNELADRIIEIPDVLPLESESVDVVLSSQVLEHVASPDVYLQEAFRVLRSDGLLILSTHGMWRYHPDPNDFWRWTCDGLRQEISRQGFKIVRFKGVMGPEATAWQLWQDAVLPRVFKPLRRLFTRYVQGRIRRADLRCREEVRDHDACVYVVVAQKG
jgi:SAM-dependent methyltransferase